MSPFSEYYWNKILEYKIIQQPSFGNVKSGKSKVNRFTHKQLESGQIQYVHDGSENATDFIRLIAIARNKESVPYDLFINIIPVNDEIPQIVTNTGVQMWVGGRAVIKNSDLSESHSHPFVINFSLYFYDFKNLQLRKITTPRLIS